jgi:hypothetical protein
MENSSTNILVASGALKDLQGEKWKEGTCHCAAQLKHTVSKTIVFETVCLSEVVNSLAKLVLVGIEKESVQEMGGGVCVRQRKGGKNEGEAVKNISKHSNNKEVN